MDNKHVFFAFLLVFSLLKSQAQTNLVPNGGFEEVEKCLSGQDTVRISRYWFSPQDRVISLDNPCFYGKSWSNSADTFSLKGARFGFFETYGFFTQLTQISHHRYYLTTQLKEPLVAGQKYYFEMSFRTVDTVPDVKTVTTFFTDGQQLAFSKDFPIYDWNTPNTFISLAPVLSSPLVTDYKWHKLKGCFEAKGGEKFLLIGNFMSNAQMVRVPTGHNSLTQFVSSSHLVDNVILVPVQVSLPDTVVCQGQTVALNVGNTLIDSMQYRWQDGTTTPQYIAKNMAHLSVQVIYPTQNCVARGDMNFTVLGTDYKSNAIDTTLCQNEKITFTAGTGLNNETITWQNGEKTHTLSANTEGVYLAKVANACARWTDTFRLRFQNCGFEAYIPNAFSPNGDHTNDDFKPFIKLDFIKIESYDFHIYNRWGSTVFASQNADAAWDGTFRGQTCESGVYIWTLKVQIVLNGKLQTKALSGDVAIIR